MSKKVRRKPGEQGRKATETTKGALSDTHPVEVDPSKARDEEEAKEMLGAVEKWIDGIAEDVGELAKKHRIKAYALLFVHPATGKVMYLSNLDRYNATRMSAVAVRRMKQEIAEELAV